MQAYKLETILQEDGKLTINDLPWKAGSNIEVIILIHPTIVNHSSRYPLRGKAVYLDKPFDSIAESDWSALL